MNGYISLDMQGFDLTADTSEAAITVSGLFEEASEAIDTGKPIYLINSVNGNKGANTPIQAFANKETTITLTASIYEISITNADAVTITRLIPSSDSAKTSTRKSTK